MNQIVPGRHWRRAGRRERCVRSPRRAPAVCKVSHADCRHRRDRNRAGRAIPRQRYDDFSTTIDGAVGSRQRRHRIAFIPSLEAACARPTAESLLFATHETERSCAASCSRQKAHVVGDRSPLDALRGTEKKFVDEVREGRSRPSKRCQICHATDFAGPKWTGFIRRVVRDSRLVTTMLVTKSHRPAIALRQKKRAANCGSLRSMCVRSGLRCVD